MMSSVSSIPETASLLVDFPEILLPHATTVQTIESPSLARQLRSALKERRPLAVVSVNGPENKTDSPAVACLARVLAASREHGRCVAVIKGVGRVLVDFAPVLLDQVRVVAAPDVYPTEGESERSALRRRLIAELLTRHPSAATNDLLSRVFSDEFPLGMLCDLVGQALGVCQGDKHRLLSEMNVDVRCQRLIEMLHALPVRRSQYSLGYSLS